MVYKRLTLVLICLGCVWIFTLPTVRLLNDLLHRNELASILAEKESHLTSVDRELKRVETQLLMGTNDALTEKTLRQEEGDLKTKRNLLQKEINVTEEKLRKIGKLLEAFDVNPKGDGLLSSALKILSNAANIFGTIFPVVIIFRWLWNRFSRRRRRSQEKGTVGV